MKNPNLKKSGSPRTLFCLAITALLGACLLHCTSSNSGGSGNDGGNNTTTTTQTPTTPTTPTGCVQTASNPVANVSSLGGTCVTPVLVDQGNGTAKDTANNLLWVRCTVTRDSGGNIVVREVSPGSCNTTNAANVWYEVPGNTQASDICNGLVYAGRSDWILPDLKQLGTYYKASAPSAPYVFDSTLYGASMYNSPSQIYHISSTTGAGSTVGFVDFSRATGSGGGSQIITNNTQGIVLCMVKL